MILSLLDTLYDKLLLSISLPTRATDTLPSSTNSRSDNKARDGASLTESTVTVNSSESVAVPSETNT